MNRYRYWIRKEPVGKQYSQLVDFCAKRAFECTFALERPQQFEKACFCFLDALRRNFIEVVNQVEWPGTKLTRSQAPVYWYRVTPELVGEMKAKVRGLYAWARPRLPEDVAFYWPDGSVLLGTSSHERFAFINLDEEEKREFAQEVPSIDLAAMSPPEAM